MAKVIKGFEKAAALLVSTREGKGLTRREVAKAVGISDSYVQMIEAAKAAPSDLICTAFEKLYSMEPGVLPRLAQRESTRPLTPGVNGHSAAATLAVRAKSNGAKRKRSAKRKTNGHAKPSVIATNGFHHTNGHANGHTLAGDSVEAYSALLGQLASIQRAMKPLKIATIKVEESGVSVALTTK